MVEGGPVRAGLIGLGAIGASIVQRAADYDDIELVGAVVRNLDRRRPDGSPPLFTRLDELLDQRPEVVVEVAGHDGLREYGPPALRAGCDLYFVAVGALADPDTERELLAAARESGRQAKIISGAIGALDALAGASVGELHRVTHTTRKPAATLMAPEDAATLTEVVEIFSGPVREGALKFPESVNVAAAVSFAGLGLDRTTLRVLADPEINRNRHEVEAEGEFGTLRFEIMNVPSADNPKTGSLVAMSIIHQLRQRRGGLVIG